MKAVTTSAVRSAAWGLLAAGVLLFFAGHGIAKADSFTMSYTDLSGPHVVTPTGGVYLIPNNATDISVSGQLTGGLTDVFCDKFGDDQSFNEDVGPGWAYWNVDSPTLITTFSLWSFAGTNFPFSYVQHANGKCNYPSPPIIGIPYIVNYSFSFPIASYSQGINHQLLISFYSQEGSGVVCGLLGNCVPQESGSESAWFDIVPPAPPSVLSVSANCSPSTLTLAASGPQPTSNCSATVTYSDGSTDSNVTWTASPAAAGSINSSSGLYTPSGGTSGTVNVTAISNVDPSKKASASILLLPAAGSVTININSVNSVDGSAVPSTWVVSGGPGISFSDSGTMTGYSEPASPVPYVVSPQSAANPLFVLNTVRQGDSASSKKFTLGDLFGLRWLLNNAEAATVCSSQAPNPPPTVGSPFCSPNPGPTGQQPLSSNGNVGNFLITWDPLAQLAASPNPVSVSDVTPNGTITVQNTGSNGSTLDWSVASSSWTGAPGGWLTITPSMSGSLSSGGSKNLTVHATVAGIPAGDCVSSPCTVTLTFTGISQPTGIPAKTAGGAFAVPITVELTIGPPAPSVAISANPTSIGLGQTTSLLWNSTSTTSCTASAAPPEADWSGSVATSGVAVVKPGSIGTETYKIKCATASGGPVNSQAVVNVTAAVGPLSLTINIGPPAIAALGVPIPVTALAGGNPCTSCTWSAPGSSPAPGNGSTIQVQYSSLGTQKITATNAADGNSSSTNVDILNDCSITSSPASIVPPNQSTLTWSCPSQGGVDVATSCDIKKSNGTVIDSFSVSAAAASGTDYVSPINTETYTLYCTANNGIPNTIMPTSTAIVAVQGPGIHETNP